MKKKPRFFCDNCGSEVVKNAKACPRCGRFFSSVRCPSCGFSGEDDLFLRGCPSCGYSAPPGKKERAPFGRTPFDRAAPPPLPAWKYIVIIAALFVVFAALAFLITR
ncbi:MAG: zinc ribbon domain-containing protein [Treponema sp.]|nr:zinc ribbon domain-containing protein [Treponema sp.]